MGNSNDSEDEAPYKPEEHYGNSPADNVIPNKVNNNYPKKTFAIPINYKYNTINNTAKSTYSIPKNVSQNNYMYKTSNNSSSMNYNKKFSNTYQNNLHNYIDKSLIKFDDIQRNPLYINLIHYDENLKAEENQAYYKYFKLNIVGGYVGIYNISLLIRYLNDIYNSKKFLRYTLIVSGSQSMNILKKCYDLEFIDDIIIFCSNPNLYSSLKSFNKISLISNSFGNIVNYLKKKMYTSRELDMSNQIPFTPLITFYEYKYCYFAIHRMLCKFFKRDWSNPCLTMENLNAVSIFLERANFEYNMKYKIALIMKNLYYSKNFTLYCIYYYTGDDLCYIFNKTLRDIGKNFDGMSHFIGPFDYALHKYLRDYPSKGIYCNKILYRDAKMNYLDLCSYCLSENDVICYPSFTSTTTKKNLNFESTANAKTVNKTLDDAIHVKMIFYYQ